MKTYLKMMLLVLLAFAPAMGWAEHEVKSVFNTSASGTTSATVFVQDRDEFALITDIAWRLDSNNTTGLIVVRPGDVRYTSTSATSSSGTVVWFANTGTAVATGEYIIILDESAGDYYLRKTIAASTTSVTVSESISPALTTSDLIWSVLGSFERPVGATNSQTVSLGAIWLPKNKPTAITVDGNTTACRISISGHRSNYK